MTMQKLKLLSLLSSLMILVSCRDKEIKEDINTWPSKPVTYYWNEGEKIPLYSGFIYRHYVAFYMADESRLKEELINAGIELTILKEIEKLDTYSFDLVGPGVETFSNCKIAIADDC